MDEMYRLDWNLDELVKNRKSTTSYPIKKYADNDKMMKIKQNERIKKNNKEIKKKVSDELIII